MGIHLELAPMVIGAVLLFVFINTLIGMGYIAMSIWVASLFV
jgi:hypothetical protein